MNIVKAVFIITIISFTTTAMADDLTNTQTNKQNSAINTKPNSRIGALLGIQMFDDSGLNNLDIGWGAHIFWHYVLSNYFFLSINTGYNRYIYDNYDGYNNLNSKKIESEVPITLGINVSLSQSAICPYIGLEFGRLIQEEKTKSIGTIVFGISAPLSKYLSLESNVKFATTNSPEFNLGIAYLIP
ncbi:MAG: hypothetical protein FWG85_06090 [Bacteroidetes bacterium]|nr:hypothetical protein [Bacteroidota bacterium]